MSLDDISSQLGEVLQRADTLLEEWSVFGRDVRRQVEREANEIGEAVRTSIDRAALTATARSVDAALAAELQARLASFAQELGRLEARARAVARHAADDRRRDRTLAMIAIAGILVANVLLAVLLLRKSPAPNPSATPVERAVLAPSDAGAWTAVDATVDPSTTAASARPGDTGTSSTTPAPADAGTSSTPAPVDAGKAVPQAKLPAVDAHAASARPHAAGKR